MIVSFLGQDMPTDAVEMDKSDFEDFIACKYSKYFEVTEVSQRDEKTGSIFIVFFDECFFITERAGEACRILDEPPNDSDVVVHEYYKLSDALEVIKMYVEE